MRGNTKIAVMIAGTFCIAPMPDRCVAQSAADLAKSMQEQWIRCLKDAFEVYEKRTPSRNSAADMAMQFCSTEEAELWTFSSETGMSRGAFDQLKAATKKALIAGK
jgi:hypothetical protein